jgi:hypothetical protein
MEVSSRPPLNLAMWNMSSAPDGGLIFVPPGPQFREIMIRSGGSTWGVIREVWRSYEGKRARLLANWLRRFVAIWASVEAPDNVSFDFHRSFVAVLRPSVTFGIVFPLGAAAIIVLLAAAVGPGGASKSSKSRPVRARGAAGDSSADRFTLKGAWRDRRAAHTAVLFYLLALAAAMTLVNPLARYRLFLVPILVCYTGVSVSLIIRLAGTRRTAALALLLAVVAGMGLAQRAATADRQHVDRRPADRLVVAQRYAARGDLASAASFMALAVEVAPNRLDIRRDYAIHLARLGRLEEAREQLEIVRLRAPNMPGLNELIEFVESQLKQDGALPSERP